MNLLSQSYLSFYVEDCKFIFQILNTSFGAKSADVDAEVNRLLYEPSNKHLCKTRLITVPEPSEPDEDSHGYTRLLDPQKNEKVEIQDSVCHV